VQTAELPSQTASATPLSVEELAKEQRKQRREKQLNRIRDSLESVRHQMAFSPAEAGILHGKSPTWAYRKIYRGEWRVISSGGRISIPRSEILRDLGGAERYNPQPRAKIGGEGNGRA
jgi:hypothetical protein